jgi:hypothetical protein
MISGALGWVPSLLASWTRRSRQSSKIPSSIKLYGDNFAAPGFADFLTV